MGLRCSTTLQIALFLDFVHSLGLHKGKQCFGYLSRSVLKPSDSVALGVGAGIQSEVNKMCCFYRWTYTSINYRHMCTLGQVTHHSDIINLQRNSRTVFLLGRPVRLQFALCQHCLCDSLYIRPATLVGAWIFLFRIGRYSRDFLGNSTDLIIIIIIIINIKDWTLWSVASPELQLFSPTFLRFSNCSSSLWSVVIWFRRDSVWWHSLQV